MSALRATLPQDAGNWIQSFEKALESVADCVGDGAVSPDSARIKGVKGFVEVPGNHLSMIHNVTVGSDRETPAILINSGSVGLRLG